MSNHNINTPKLKKKMKLPSKIKREKNKDIILKNSTIGL